MVAVSGRSVEFLLRGGLAVMTAGVLLAACGGGGSRSVPPTAAAGHFTTPANLARPVPPPPPAITPPKPSAAKRGPVANAPHAAFFAGEAPLSNGVYYLALPNGNPFGYYSYLPDSNYIYHFDIGYLYVFDANDGKGGVYFYDFTSGHWWYTGREYPFPYVYDFSRSAMLYYYPDTNNALHYTTNPRFFFNFAIGQVISSPPEIVTTLAGSSDGYADGTGTAAHFSSPHCVAVDAGGNVYVADTYNQSIRKITPGGAVTTLGAGAGFRYPDGVAVDGGGNVYVADSSNHQIRKITPGGVVSTLAGGASGYADGTGTAAQFRTPSGVAVDGGGNVYVADSQDNRIRKITPGGVVTTFAGSGTAGFANGSGTAAQFDEPYGLAVDGAGNVFVADTANNRIRKITPGGVVSTYAGDGIAGITNGTAAQARFYFPEGVGVDVSSGNVYVADSRNHTIREITPNGVVTLLAGNNGDYPGPADGTGYSARFDHPSAVTVDASGNLYVADTGNNKIRKVQ